MGNAVRDLGFRITGLDCAEEVAILKRAVGPLVGGDDQLAFDILQAKMTVLNESVSASTAAIIQAVERTGMRAEPWREQHPANQDDPFWQRWGRIVLLAVCGVLGLIGFLIHAAAKGSLMAALSDGSDGIPVTFDGWLPRPSSIIQVLRVAPHLAFYGASLLVGVWPLLPKAWHALRRLQPDMNLLMTVAVIGAVGVGEWLEGVTVAFLFGVSLALESWSVGRARRAIAALLNLAPPTARVRNGDTSESLVAPEAVAVGTIFIVQPGERFPLDGRVVSGSSHVDQAPITGESVPVAKSSGAEVFAGTINGDGTLEVQCTKLAGETTLAHIVRMVGEAQSRRAPAEQWVERFARVYTPAVMAVSLAVMLIPPLAFGEAWSEWFYNALVLLVIACPCALVISTPVSIVAGLAAAARNGVLIKGGSSLEAPGKLRALVFDKTGTLTRGHPAVVNVVPFNDHTETDLLERAAAMESRSDHPLARAIVEFARQRGVQPAPAEAFEIIPGKGANAQFNGRPFWLGSHRYLEERGQETPDLHTRLESLSADGLTVVVIGNANHVCGLIALADEIRTDVREVLVELRQTGIEHIAMLTGDNVATARSVATAVAVDDFAADLLPADKVATIESLVAKYGRVGMIGDGVNDAPALARATVGIAMGAAGSDAAIETADVSLMSDDLTRLPWLIRHSRRTLAIIRQNTTFALAVKGCFVVLTVAGAANLWSAIAADMGASLLVIFNGLRLLNARA